MKIEEIRTIEYIKDQCDNLGDKVPAHETKELKTIQRKNAKIDSCEPLVDFCRFIAYWFPLNTGFNRLILVICCLIAIITALDYPERLNTFLLVLGIEAVAYIAIIWIFRGFKKLPKESENEKE
jgi:hypothetical protein